MLSDDSDALQSGRHAALGRILEKALPNMNMSIDDLQFKTTEDPDPHSTHLITEPGSARRLIYMDDSILVHPEHSGCTGAACIAADVVSEIHGKIGSTALADLLRLLYQVGVDAKQNTSVVRDNINDGRCNIWLIIIVTLNCPFFVTGGTIHSDVELRPEGDVDEDSDALSSSAIMIESRTGVRRKANERGPSDLRSGWEVGARCEGRQYS